MRWDPCRGWPEPGGAAVTLAVATSLQLSPMNHPASKRARLSLDPTALVDALTQPDDAVLSAAVFDGCERIRGVAVRQIPLLSLQPCQHLPVQQNSKICQAGVEILAFPEPQTRKRFR
jgi:hypothetical protein